MNKDQIYLGNYSQNTCLMDSVVIIQLTVYNCTLTFIQKTYALMWNENFPYNGINTLYLYCVHTLHIFFSEKPTKSLTRRSICKLLQNANENIQIDSTEISKLTEQQVLQVFDLANSNL